MNINKINPASLKNTDRHYDQRSKSTGTCGRV